MPLTNKDFDQLAEAMEKNIKLFVEKCQDLNPKNKTGGCLVYMHQDGSDNFSFLGTNIGDREKYYDTAFRKIGQLRDNPDHISSYQSRDPESGLWGGGFKLPWLGWVSFSGLPELADEACLLKSCVDAGLLTDSEDDQKLVKEILKTSDNPVFDRLVD
jgi:hypothetical protein